MEDNKYYTPSIDEFHVGFEYQFNHKDKGWIDLKFGDTDDWSILEIDMEIENNEIRVKYLDQEDIESLGWKHIGSLWFEKGDYKLRKWKDQSLDIYFEYADRETIMIFRGDVKNKSELRKLMKQLNIE